jgi:hypothetical protein
MMPTIHFGSYFFESNLLMSQTGLGTVSSVDVIRIPKIVLAGQTSVVFHHI